ncbi:MAG TPA: GxxExxY protein [Anaerolineaceae bacterium]|nr:GxxExxY protein [Anaerolineaceae bacterium]
MESIIDLQTESNRKLSDITSLVTVAAENVYNSVGPGFELQIYQRAIGLELDALKIPYSRELWVDLIYRQQRIGHKRVDFVVDDLMILVRAQLSLEIQDEIQASTYLRNSGCKAVLLVNFGGDRFEFRSIQQSAYANY